MLVNRVCCIQSSTDVVAVVVVVTESMAWKTDSAANT